MLAFEGVGRVYRDAGQRHVALDGVTFRLAPGTLTALTGENGAGKTTLLRLAATLEEPTRGLVRVAGATGADARARLGWLGQDAGLYGALTARENLAFAARFHGREDDIRMISERLALRLDAPARLLSRGERQRVAIARAFLGGDLVLLDEPTTALDAEGRDRFLRLLDESRGKRTVLVATHDEAVVAKCDRVLTLRGGRLA